MRGFRRAGIVGLSTVVAASMMSGVAIASLTFSFDRLQGTDRYATTVATASSYGASTNVILASGVPGHYPDALTASYLAGFRKAPIMLTQLAATPANVLARIAASGATDVWLVGGTGVISPAQEGALGVTYTVHRLGGADRYLTSAAVIGAVGVAPSATHTALLATGVDFPDALGGGPLSYVKGMPLAITATNTLPAATLSALKAAGITNVIVLGGPTVITANVINALAAGGITLNQRIYGADRAATSANLATYMLTQGFSNTAVNVASGYTFGGGADALGAASLSGKENRPTLITDSATVVGPGIIAYLTAHANTLTSGHIFGGTGAVSLAAEATMQAAARTVTTNQDLTVTPSAAATLTVSSPEDATDDRTFTASGLSDSLTYTVALFPAANVTTNTSGVVRFADTATPADQADGYGSQLVASIIKTNGVTTAQVGSKTITSVNGTLNFTIDGNAAGSVVPVLFVDAVVRGALDLNAANEPTELFGLGGTTTYSSLTAGSGPIAATNVVSVDKAGNTFRAGPGGNVRTYAYDTKDNFSIVGTGSVSMAAFEAALSTGDGITGTYATTGVSTFTLTDSQPAAPTSVEAEKGATAATTNDITVTVVPGASAFDSIVIQRAPVTGGTDDVADGVVGTYATITTATTDADLVTAGFQYVDNNVAAGVYRYRAALVKDGDQGPYATDNNESSVTPVIDVTPPTALDSRMATNADSLLLINNGDSFTVAFNEDMASPSANDTVRLSDGDGSVYDLVNGSGVVFSLNAAPVTVGATTYSAGRVLTVAITTLPADLAPGSIAGLNVPATITAQAGTTDLAGNPWNLAGSADLSVN